MSIENTPICLVVPMFSVNDKEAGKEVVVTEGAIGVVVVFWRCTRLLLFDI